MDQTRSAGHERPGLPPPHHPHTPPRPLRSRLASDSSAAPKAAGTRYVQACAPVEERPLSGWRYGGPALPGKHAWHSKAVGGAAPRAEHGRTGPTQGGPRAVAWQAPPALPAAVSTRARPASNGRPSFCKTWRPLTPRAAAVSGSWRPVSPEAQLEGATAVLPAARLGEPCTAPPRHSPSGAPTAAPKKWPAQPAGPR